MPPPVPPEQGVDLDILFLQGLDKPDIGPGGDERLFAQGSSVGQQMEELVLEGQGPLDHEGNAVGMKPRGRRPMMRSPTASFSPVTILAGGAMMPVTQPDKEGALRTGGSALTR